MRLTRIEIFNLLSFEHFELNLDDDQNLLVFIGANGSGKSNFFRVLNLFENYFKSKSNTKFSSDLFCHGTSNEHIQPKVSLEFLLSEEEKNRIYHYTLVPGCYKALLSAEAMGDKIIYQFALDKVEYVPKGLFTRSVQRSITIAFQDRGLWPLTEDYLAEFRGTDKCTLRRVKQVIANGAHETEENLSRTTLPTALRYIYNKLEVLHRVNKYLLFWLGNELHFDSINEQWLFSASGSNRRMDLFYASGGLMEGITIAVALCLPVDLICLDEPAVNWHPAAQSRLLSTIREITNSKQKRIFLTTHSPHFVLLNNDFLKQVYLCTRDKNNVTQIQNVPKLFPTDTGFLQAADRKPILFSRRFILVEGIHDWNLFSNLQNVISANMKNEKGESLLEYDVFRMDSKTNMVTATRLVRVLGVPFIMLMDSDAIIDIKNQTEWREGDNLGSYNKTKNSEFYRVLEKLLPEAMWEVARNEIESIPLPGWEDRNQYKKDLQAIGKRYGVYCWSKGAIEAVIGATIKGFTKADHEKMDKLLAEQIWNDKENEQMEDFKAFLDERLHSKPEPWTPPNKKQSDANKN